MKTSPASRKPTEARRVAFDYVSKYPEMPNRTLARLMRKERPKLYDSIERARSHVRIIKGQHGEWHRQNVYDKTFVLPKPTADNPLSLPEGKTEGWCPYVLPDEVENILVIGDVHVPFHDLSALTVALSAGERAEVDCVILNGDFADCYSLSRFDKNPEIRDFPAEREAVRHALMAIRNMFPDARIIYKQGNHEMRFEAVLQNKAPDLYGLSEFRLPVLFDLYNMGIEWIDLKRPIFYRELNILHGHELPSRTGGVNPARTTLLKTRECSLVHHFHRKTGDMQPTMRGRQIQAWSVGCLCDLHPQYMPINDWQHGFAIVKGGKDWRVKNYAIIGNEVV